MELRAVLPDTAKQQEARNKLLNLEASSRLKEQVECPLRHMFAPGMYAREIRVPKGTVVVTKIHKQDHFTFVLEGRCSVYCDDEIKEVIAPCMFETAKGTKRAVYVHEDTTWITVHHNPDNLTDLEQLESIFIAKDFSEIEHTMSNFLENKKGDES